jgi:putative ABC transport system ATP-binding protein
VDILINGSRRTK